ncbi:receptor L domain protein [Ancylostoma caninum]|uniref:Receptor L domain protein n=1 Tax=Ancylostoma caninum TaxID=29170 RepID=A0A368GTR4_ANCCA|nr:receptor L domain protein [Ancylostoma caninum]
MNNAKLEMLPDFEWKKDDLVHFFISDNPKLDTAVLREKIGTSKVPADTFIQKPFTCGPGRTTSCGCRIIEDDVVIGLEKNEDLESVVEIDGTLKIANTSLEELPEMPKLRRIIQKNGLPTLIIQDNPELTSIQSISYVDEVVNADPKKAVVIKNNPKLCINLEDEDAPFVLSYGDGVRRCPSNQFQ